MSHLDSVIDFLMGLDRTEVVFCACILVAPIGGFWYQYEETDDSFIWQLHHYARTGSHRD